MRRSRMRAQVDGEAGFSLVELLVIVAILGILALLAISTYLDQRRTAERAAAISALTNTRLAAASVVADLGYLPGEPGPYQDEQPAYRYVSDASTGSGVVSVAEAGDGVDFAVAARGRCYHLRVLPGGDLVRATGELVDGACPAGSFPAEGTGEWS